MKNDGVETVEILRLAQGGDGVAQLADGRVVFVRDALPGDVVGIELQQSKKTWARAEIRHVVRGSAERIESDCKHSAHCGGCSFRELAYEAEFREKIAAATQTLERIGKLDLSGVALHEHRAAAGAQHRVRARLHVRKGALGYFRRGSHDLFPIVECPALDARIGAVLPALRSFAKGVGNGELFVETAGPRDIVVSLETGSASAAACADLLAKPGVRGVATGDDSVGDAWIDTAEAIGVRSQVGVPPRRFRQANAAMSKTLRDLVRERVGACAMLDEYYAGSGNFTFALRDQCADIRAFELDPEAVRLANDVRYSLGIRSIAFAVADLEEGEAKPRDGARVLLDPPRTGAEHLCRELATSSAEAIVYVSCDAATLARDARLLNEGGFLAASIDFVDMFPRTPHLELIAVFRKSAREPSSQT